MAKYFRLFFFLLISTQVFAQDPTFFSPQSKRILRKADNHLQEKVPEIQEALKLYLQAERIDKKNAAIKYKIGICLLHTRDKLKSIHYLEAANRLNPEISHDLNYMLGISYHLNEDFEQAIEKFSTYLSTLSDKDVLKKKVSRIIAPFFNGDRNWSLSYSTPVYNVGILVRKKIEECKNAISLMETPVQFRINSLGKNINSPYADYAPVISADESVLYFTSRRGNEEDDLVDEKDQAYYENIYKSDRNGKRWGEAVDIGEPINSSLHESAIALSADGQTLFIYRDTKNNPNDNGDIYIAKLNGDTWSTPKSLDEINSDYTERAVSFSGDEHTLFLVSDRPGGQGKDDIYISIKNEKGEWTTPQNLGPTINTEYHERGVYFHPDGKTLYFCSQGHNTMGGFDVFYTQLDSTGNWSSPKNIGYPINTPGDDYHYIVSSDGKRAYYSSEKAGGMGSHDIYQITLEEEVKTYVTILKGIVRDKETEKPLGAELQIVDNESRKLIGKYRSNQKTGKYLVTLPSGKNYGISVRKPKYLFYSENVIIPDKNEYQEINKDIDLSHIHIGAKIILRNIFFDFAKATLRSESETELKKAYEIMIDNPNIQVEIGGHTDNKGNDEFNQRLSNDRAKAVVDYLIDLGIDEFRLRSKGYGEKKPIAPNTNEDGSDNPEGRALNRRTEFTIIAK